MQHTRNAIYKCSAEIFGLILEEVVEDAEDAWDAKLLPLLGVSRKLTQAL